jgi:polyphosphate kinase 2 (PPK2 family)
VGVPIASSTADRRTDEARLSQLLPLYSAVTLMDRSYVTMAYVEVIPTMYISDTRRFFYYSRKFERSMNAIVYFLVE